MAKKKPIVVSLDQEQIDWLESKTEEGYSKPGLIRYAVKRLMEESSKAKVKELEAEPKSPTKQLTHSVGLSQQEEPITQSDPKSEQAVQQDKDFKEVKEAILFYRRNPWAIDRIEDEQLKAFVIDVIKKIEERLPVGGPPPEIKHKRGRPSKVNKEDWYGPNYRPQRAPDGTKIGTPRTGAKYEDMETSVAVLAWSIDNPGEPMPRWLYDAQTQGLIDEYKKTHKY